MFWSLLSERLNGGAPLWAKTGRVLRNWFRECEVKATEVAFRSVRGTLLSSDGLNYILQQAVRRAADALCPSLLTKRVTPHLVRHTCAMHLLQAGIDMAVIALWLGHESIETTHIYVEAGRVKEVNPRNLRQIPCLPIPDAG
jgi:integrase/recombinase XerD